MQCGENLLRFETRFDTPAGGLAAWWRIETWAREEGIGLIPGPGRRGTGQNRQGRAQLQIGHSNQEIVRGFGAVFHLDRAF